MGHPPSCSQFGSALSALINASEKHQASRGAPGSFARQEQRRLAQDDNPWERREKRALPSRTRPGRPRAAVPTWPVVGPRLLISDNPCLATAARHGAPARKSTNHRSVAMEEEVHQRGDDQQCQEEAKDGAATAALWSDGRGVE